MKPLVIYVNKSNDKIILSQKEFEKYLLEAYEQGLTDGKMSYYSVPVATWNGSTATEPFKYETQITCEAHNSVGD